MWKVFPYYIFITTKISALRTYKLATDLLFQVFSFSFIKSVLANDLEFFTARTHVETKKKDSEIKEIKYNKIQHDRPLKYVLETFLDREITVTIWWLG